MQTFEVSFVMPNLAPDRCFAHIADPQRIAQGLAKDGSDVAIDNDSGTLPTFLVAMEGIGSLEYAITKLESPRELIVSSSGSPSFQYSFLLTPLEDGTTIRATLAVKGPGASLLKKGLRKEFEEEIGGLEAQLHELVGTETVGHAVAEPERKATRNCPWCGETILAVAKKCRYCHELLDVASRKGNTTLPGADQTKHTPTGPVAMVCPHCGTKARVTTKPVKVKRGISGGKATAALFTAGGSMILTGLSRKEKATEAYCSRCRNRWVF